MAVIQFHPSWQLNASVKQISADQHHLIISSFIATARRPEHHVQFSGTFSANELRALRDVIDQVLEVAA